MKYCDMLNVAILVIPIELSFERESFNAISLFYLISVYIFFIVVQVATGNIWRSFGNSIDGWWEDPLEGSNRGAVHEDGTRKRQGYHCDWFRCE